MSELFTEKQIVAWRVMDAKYFGVPQQRKRIYLLGGKDFHPDKVLFEIGDIIEDPFKPKEKKNTLSLFGPENNFTPPKFDLVKEINGHRIEAFRSYSDCLYAAYGTKWNGNAAALNGSLFFAQDGRLRRLCPLECERLMGFPDDYTLLDMCTDTQRYQAVGNSWAVPVIKWIANRLLSDINKDIMFSTPSLKIDDVQIHLLDDFNEQVGGKHINASKIPYDYTLSNLVEIADTTVPEKFYITSKGCAGILRRKYQYDLGMNARLEMVLQDCS